MIRNFIRKYKSLNVKYKEPDITYLENIDDFEKKLKIIANSLREKGYLFIKTKSIFGDEIVDKKNLIEKLSANIIKRITTIPIWDKKKMHPFLIARNGDEFLVKRKHFAFNSSKGQWYHPDYGLIDIFNPNEFDEIFHDKKFSIIIKNLIKIISESEGKKVEISHTNFYYYKSNIYPRCLHYDSTRDQWKIFIIVKGVQDFYHGPYCYVPKSQRSFLRKVDVLLNKLIGSDLGSNITDANLYSSSEATPFFCDTLDIVLTKQTGAHGDLPSIPHSEKSSFVINIF